ncbi:TraB/GumN family protein [Chitinolyticbacter albus]|uniref:TraB/GumN family protein n=1 Tax=Chitinolyticbacter albus TaxID=2961951 RepID=UPI00210D7399|nr:TraB/GumN family protein [Chitinolyticbacter albus]
MLSCLRRFIRPLLGSVTALALFIPASQAGAADQANAFARTHLWRIDKAGMAPSWLFGTIHVADPKVTTLSPAVQEAFSSAERVATEFRLDFGAFMEMAKAVLLPEGESLADKLDAPHYQRLVAALEKRQYPEAAVRRFKPWAAAMFIATPTHETGQLPLDLKLTKEAVEGGKSYDGIETIAEQLAVFSDMPEDKQLILLKSLIDQQGSLASEHEKLIQLYVARDYAAMQALSDPSKDPMMKGLSAKDRAYFINWQQKTLLDERNTVMAQRIAKVLPQGNAFFAVGALHLPGKNGLVQKLRDAGYTLTPLDLPAK